MNEEEAHAAHALATFETEELLGELDRLVHVYEGKARQERRAGRHHLNASLPGRHTAFTNYHYGRAHAYEEAALALRLALDGESPGRPRIGAASQAGAADALAYATPGTHLLREEIEIAGNENGWALNEGLPDGMQLELIRTDMFQRGDHRLDVNYRYVRDVGYLGEVTCAYYDGRSVDGQDKAESVLGLLRQASTPAPARF